MRPAYPAFSLRWRIGLRRDATRAPPQGRIRSEGQGNLPRAVLFLAGLDSCCGSPVKRKILRYGAKPHLHARSLHLEVFMALMGRPPLGPRLVDALEISEDSQKKLRLILETIAGQKTLAEAAQELCISETRFHVIRQEALLGAGAALEPGTPGRPPTQKRSEERRV